MLLVRSALIDVFTYAQYLMLQIKTGIYYLCLICENLTRSGRYARLQWECHVTE